MNTPLWVTLLVALVGIIGTVTVAVANIRANTKRDERAWQREDAIRAEERQRADDLQYSKERLRVYADFLGTINALVAKRPDDSEGRQELYRLLYVYDSMVAIVASPAVYKMTREYVELATQFNRAHLPSQRKWIATQLEPLERALIRAIRDELGVGLPPDLPASDFERLDPEE